jgi:hypothetical protein
MGRHTDSLWIKTKQTNKKNTQRIPSWLDNSGDLVVNLSLPPSLSLPSVTVSEQVYNWKTWQQKVWWALMLFCSKPWEAEIVAAYCQMKPLSLRLETDDILTPWTASFKKWRQLWEIYVNAATRCLSHRWDKIFYRNKKEWPFPLRSFRG